MGYIEQHLLPGEKVVYRATPHWVLLGLPLSLLFVTALFFLYSVLTDRGFATLLGCGFFALLLFMTLSAAVTYFTMEFALTDRRIVAKEGFVRRRSVELLLTQVESIGVNQPIVGRILDYGTITVVGTGGTREPFRVIADPMELRRRVHMQISEGS